MKTRSRVRRLAPRLFPLPLALLALSLWVAPAPAFDTGPPDGVAGEPPNHFNCTICHSDYPVNSGNGRIALTGMPSSFMPGHTYTVTVSLRDPGQLRWGFELTALDQSLNPAGTFTITDTVHTQLSELGGGLPDFVKQTEAGTYEHTPDGPVTWSFDWTAPGASSVTFYFAGNAANDDDDITGDYIYADSLVIPQGTTAVESGTWGRIKSLFGTR